MSRLQVPAERLLEPCLDQENEVDGVRGRELRKSFKFW